MLLAQAEARRLKDLGFDVDGAEAEVASILAEGFLSPPLISSEGLKHLKFIKIDPKLAPCDPTGKSLIGSVMWHSFFAEGRFVLKGTSMASVLS